MQLAALHRLRPIPRSLYAHTARPIRPALPPERGERLAWELVSLLSPLARRALGPLPPPLRGPLARKGGRWR